MYFAEFLNANSSVRLSIFSSPTCVGLRYGPSVPYLRNYFSARRLHALHFAVASLAFAAHLLLRICLELSTTYYLDRDYRRPAALRPMLRSIETQRGTGMLTSFPSTTLFSLALGAD